VRRGRVVVLVTAHLGSCAGRPQVFKQRPGRQSDSGPGEQATPAARRVWRAPRAS
jgi:hypothetical protein